MQMLARRMGVGLVAVVSLLSLGCKGGGGESPADAGSEEDIDVCSTAYDFPLGDASGHADPLGVEAGQARAGRLAANQLPPDPNGLSTVEAGDFVLANEHIAVIIEDAGPSDLWDEWGGKPVGLGLMRDGAIAELVDFNELIPSIGQFTLNTESVTVLNDGSDGGSAIVRAVGTLHPIGSLGQLLALAFAWSNRAFVGMKAALEYELRPGARYVDVTYRVVNTEEDDLETHSLHLFFQDSRMPMFGPGSGFGTFPAESPFIAFVDKGTSYAWVIPDDAPEPFYRFFINVSGATVLRFPQFEMRGCRVHRQTIGRMHIGGPNVDGLLAAKAIGEGQAQREITGTVTDPQGDPGGVSIHVTYDEAGETKYLTRTVTASDGTYRVRVPADLAVDLHTWRRGDVPKGPVRAAVSDTVVNFTLDPVGFIEVTAIDQDAEELPVRVQVIPNGSPAYTRPPASYGELALAGGRLHVAFPIDGKVTLRVPPGMHDVVVSRGYDYTAERNAVAVSAGVATPLPVQLDRVVERAGYMCGDFHIHTFRSPDAGDPKDFKIQTAIADGVEIPVLTDHRFVGDFEETIQSMGAEVAKWAYGVSAIELTTFMWGHMGVFPLLPDSSLPNAGSFDWPGRQAPDVFDEARSRDSGFAGVNPAIIIMHGRDFGGVSMGEYFAAVGYDATTGGIQNPGLWDDEFRLVEVFNDKSFSQMVVDGSPRNTLRDWFSFLNNFTDRPYFAVGSSDSHDVLKKTSPVGYPRTCVNVGTNDVADMRNNVGAGVLRDVMYETGDFTVNGGIFVTAVGPGGEHMGDTVTSAGAQEFVHVRVEAPCWVDVNRLEVWVNGGLTETIPLAGTNGASCTSAVRLDDPDILVAGLTAPSGRDWVIFHAAGDTPMSDVHIGRLPFGVTNPIFFTH
jgi:hypothetical protein